jgi:hypothetical protein
MMDQVGEGVSSRFKLPTQQSCIESGSHATRQRRSEMVVFRKACLNAVLVSVEIIRRHTDRTQELICQLMLHPLASLWRQSCRVTFYESGGQTAEALFRNVGLTNPPHVLGARRHFSSADEAFNYLRYWLSEPGARAELKWVLQRSGPSLVTAHGGVDGWLYALAGRLKSGAVAVMEEHARHARPGRLVAPPASGASAAALSSLPALSALPTLPVPENLLPILEDIRIEGAEVLPELNQSLEQVAASISSVESASLSLEPAPAKVADITASITEATTRATTELSEL